MLAQSNSRTVAAPGSFRAQRDAEVWEKIEALLRLRNAATTREISEAIGLSPAATYKRLVALLELEEVRIVAPQRGSSVQSWALCTEADAALARRVGPLITKAVQTGGVRRDPLVAALFGEPRCVSCHEPQGALHREGCMFNGLDIDAAHHVMEAQ